MAILKPNKGHKILLESINKIVETGTLKSSEFKVLIEGRGPMLNELKALIDELGLSDYLGNVDYVAREIIGHKRIEDFTTYETFADRFAKQLGVSIGLEIKGKLFNNFVLK